MEFAGTESDDLATFPVFYDFLKQLAQAQPDLVMTLVEDHLQRMSPFLTPMLVGLHASARKIDIEVVEQRWIAAGTHLSAMAKSLFNGGGERVDTLAAIVLRARELDDRDTLALSMGVAANLHVQGGASAKNVFMQGLRALACQGDARWASNIWLGSDFKALVVKLDAEERAEVLRALVMLPELDYQTEDVLRAIGEHDVEAVLAFLAERLREEGEDRAERRSQGRGVVDDKFEAIPYNLHGLQKLLAKHPVALLAVVRHSFESQEVPSLFPYVGAGRLLKGVFPNFEPQLQALVLQSLASGQDRDVEFTLAVVRTYGGSAPILDVCKAIVRVAPEHSQAWRELAAALETTGGVWGEYGLAEAYEITRDGLVAWKADPDVKVKAFADWLTEHLERMIAFERQQADESIALRKYQYGAGNNDM